ALALGDKRIPLRDVSGQSLLTRQMVDINRLQANSMGGKVQAHGSMWFGPPDRYEAALVARNIDIRALAPVRALHERKQLNLAAPLSDWRENMKRTNIPILSDVAGEIAGGVQKFVNAATRRLFYEFRASGTLSDPSIKAVPAPILTDNAALIFGKMLKDARQH